MVCSMYLAELKTGVTKEMRGQSRGGDCWASCSGPEFCDVAAMDILWMIYLPRAIEA